MTVDDLRASDVMAHLLDALEQGTDIGHYGRLAFTMIGRFFLSEDELVGYLSKEPGVSEQDARGLYLQVKAHGYSPPRRDRLIEWQGRQDFPICPDPDDPASCNVYDDLTFPDDVYEHISEFYEEQAEAQEAG